MPTYSNALHHKKIAVWGLGAVGKAAIKLLHAQHTITLIERRPLDQEEIDFLQDHAVILETDPYKALEGHEIIIPSPGVDLGPYAHYAHKFLTELDMIQMANLGPTIAITGSAGKTTVTYSIASLLQKDHQVFLGGNIGHAMLYAIQEAAEVRVLEVSSFQLEHTKHFAPDLAVITTFFANHLDRHKTLDAYRAIKLRLLRNQQPHQHALIPLELMPHVASMHYQGNLHTFSLKAPLDPPMVPLYYAEGDTVYRAHRDTKIPLICGIPKHGFTLNWIIIAAALDTIGKRPNTLEVPPSPILAHRLEWCAEHNGIEYYNDSKATIMESTHAAVDELGPQTILLLGGLSKGIDRCASIHELNHKIKKIVCFGQEASMLHGYARQAGIPSSAHETLPDAFNAAQKAAQWGDCILLSPGGSSFDLYQDYKERGNAFKALCAMAPKNS